MNCALLCLELKKNLPMNIHEYQAKEILARYGVAIQRGKVASTVDEAMEAARAIQKETKSDWLVIKAQIHAGGRGKGKIIQTGSHGVILAKNIDQIGAKSAAILGGTLVTHQTGAEGKKVNKILIAEDVYYPGASKPKEYYLSILLDRAVGQNVIMASTEGGMDIETVAKNTPEKLSLIHI